MNENGYLLGATRRKEETSILQCEDRGKTMHVLVEAQRG